MLALCWHSKPAHCVYYYSGIFYASLTWPDLFSAGVSAGISAPAKILPAIRPCKKYSMVAEKGHPQPLEKSLRQLQKPQQQLQSRSGNGDAAAATEKPLRQFTILHVTPI